MNPVAAVGNVCLKSLWSGVVISTIRRVVPLRIEQFTNHGVSHGVVTDGKRQQDLGTHQMKWLKLERQVCRGRLTAPQMNPACSGEFASVGVVRGGVAVPFDLSFAALRDWIVRNLVVFGGFGFDCIVAVVEPCKA